MKAAGPRSWLGQRRCRNEGQRLQGHRSPCSGPAWGCRWPAADASAAGRRLAAIRPPTIRRSVQVGPLTTRSSRTLRRPHLPREDIVPEPAVPHPDPGPATNRPRPSVNGTAPPKPAVPPMPSEVTHNGTALPKPAVPPMPSEVTTTRTRAQRPADGVSRTPMSALRKMMHRAPRHA
jgi:hypothetical protein